LHWKLNLVPCTQYTFFNTRNCISSFFTANYYGVLQLVKLIEYIQHLAYLLTYVKKLELMFKFFFQGFNFGKKGVPLSNSCVDYTKSLLV
jgi:hypothetical protein